jgi:lanthionine synthetase-like protein
MLFREGEHEPLTETRWDEARARAAIAEIVADAGAAIEDETWPIHPLDDDELVGRQTTLYLGSAGLAWALGTLGSRLDAAAIAERALDDYRREPDFGEAVPAFLTGESGILLALDALAPDASRADRLYDLVRANAGNETNELMWGSPGTMLAAGFLHRRTGDRRWLDAWRESAAVLLSRWEEDGLWTQRLYGSVRRFLGPAHGFAGNVLVLLAGGEDVGDRATRLLEARASREDGLANWDPVDGARADEIRVQWCHGAPGMVASLSALPCEELLLAGGELTWRAGPLAKGSGLCHGTAGNGYAFLKLFERTQDDVWLERARRFAMHAIEQVARARAEHGRGRFTLWTGDVGVALYLRGCLEADARFPTLDYW